MNKRVVITCLLLVVFISGWTQDVQFTQFYAAPLYLNPAFAGSSMNPRVISNNRIQWTGLSVAKSFNTYSFSADHFISKYKSGVGLLCTYSSAGTGRLQSVDLGLQYSFHIDLNSRWKLKPGLQASYVTRSIDYSSLLFGDQIYEDGQAPLSQDRFDAPNAHFFDFSTGFLLYEKHLWLGMAANHLNTPNQSLTATPSPLPTKFSFHGGYKIVTTSRKQLKKNYGRHPESSISPAFSYRSQGKFDQLDLGLYFFFEPLVIGAWYRGIPIFKSYKSGYGNNDAIAALIGVRFRGFSFGYSYDLTISRLSAYSSGGAHEISLCYIFDLPQRRKIDRSKMRLPCPEFYNSNN